ncbi:MAG: thioredoxin family protein [Acidobacteriota bacterium]
MSLWNRSRRLLPAAALRAIAVALPVVLAISSFTPPAGAQFPGAEHRAGLEVAVDRTAYEPGTTVRVAARVAIDDHWHVNSNTPTYDYLIPTELSFELVEGAEATAFQYPPHKMMGFAFTEEPIAVYEGTITIVADVELPADIAAGTYDSQAALRYQACDDRQCLPPVTAKTAFQIVVGSGGQAANAGWFEAAADPAAASGAAASQPATAAAPESANLAWMLVLAMLGGLILNAMPCVLPVLSLKVFALVKSAGEGRSQLVMGTLATTAGIVASFWALALAAVLAAKAGAAVGWGIQFQQPGFVTFLAVAMVLFALNMWGLFEIPLPQSLAQVGGSGPREGLAGHFASGLFATLMATPCSAPFLGTAIGFALSQSTPVIFAIFTAVGLGLALPYLLLAVFPGAAKLLPKPGAWMLTFKNLMGFLLAAAAVWLFYVLAAQISSEYVAFVQLALLALALATWLFRHYEGQPGRRRLSAIGITLAAIGSIALAATAPPAAAKGDTASGLIGWVSFDETEAQRLAGEGKLVFVDFTADWCLTCKATKRLVIETNAVAKAFEEHEVVPMKADWTNRDDRITEVMARYGRAAVPFYLLYRPGQEPYAFGDLLTKDSLISALDQAGAQVAAR